MRVYVFGAYKDFECMAGRCPATCCSGWKIVVDREAYIRFQKLEDTALGEDILSNIVEDKGMISFKNRANGDCAMLDSDGLCRIQRNSDEKTLCNTCRKYPRLSFKDGDIMLLSMAASCPVVIEWLCHSNNVWYEMAEDKKLYPLQANEIPELEDEIYKFDIMFTKISEKYLKRSDTMCDLFYDFADIGVDLIINCKDCLYLDGSFDIYEGQMDADTFREKSDRFIEAYEEKLLRFEKNYRLYRILTGKYETSGQKLSERLYQIAGEIIMNRVILFSLTQTENKDFQSDIIQSVHWVYKTAVHGKNSGSIMHKKILENLAK